LTVPFKGCPFESFVGEKLSQIDRAHLRFFNPSEEKLETLFSVNIDENCRKEQPLSRRWDYGLWYIARTQKRDGHICFVEIHKAEAGEVSVVIEKKRWLEDLIFGIRLPQRTWLWVPSGKMLIPKHSSHFRKLANSGIKLVSRVAIPQ
jgi:hypothetical protein